MSARVYEIPVKSIEGAPVNLADYKGQVLLVVNVASKCGMVAQYQGLEALYEQYKAKGFTVLGFPANDFQGQEPGSNSEIQLFCREKYGVKFPMFEKIVVRGDGQSPLYQYLTTTLPESAKKLGSHMEQDLVAKGLGRKKKEDVLWNFEKFLISRDGKVVGRFAPDVTPEDDMLLKGLHEQLDKKAS